MNKFTQKYDEAFLGAEGWGINCEIEPFITYDDEYVIIVDKNGISVIDESDNSWINDINLDYFTAKLIVESLEKMDLNEFVATAKTSPEYTFLD
jgi:hypothetical protein